MNCCAIFSRSTNWLNHNYYTYVVLREGVFLGSGVTVAPGVSIGEGSFVGIGSVVTKDIPPGVVAAGMPARIVRKV